MGNRLLAVHVGACRVVIRDSCVDGVLEQPRAVLGRGVAERATADAERRHADSGAAEFPLVHRRGTLAYVGTAGWRWERISSILAIDASARSRFITQYCGNGSS